MRRRGTAEERMRKVRESWDNDWIFDNHVEAPTEFQILDTLRDIRGILFFIAILFALTSCTT